LCFQVGIDLERGKFSGFASFAAMEMVDIGSRQKLSKARSNSLNR
jgi:hypothetical protein